MKSVLISIQPKWCELIASGKKTVEVRKTKPKLETPFKVYIYCSHNNRKNSLHTYINSGYGRKNFGVIGNWRSGKDIVDVNPHLPAYRYNAYLAEGKVIGEFLCDKVVEFENDCYTPAFDETADLSCVGFEGLYDYLGTKEYGYGWHISALVIYDKPKELSEFSHTQEHINKIRMSVSHWEYGIDDECARPLRRPPQSWCYVEGE